MQGNGSQVGSPSNLNNAANYNFAPYSTNDNMHGFATTLPQMGSGNNDPFGDLFSPSILKSVNNNGSNNTNNNGYFNPAQQNSNTRNSHNGGDSTAGIPDNRVFRFNSTSNTSDSASPSASSLSQWNANGTANSSCGTSPEPSHESPANKDKTGENYGKSSLQNTYNTIANANTNNAFMSSQYANNNLGGFDLGNTNPAYNVPQLDSFDPVLFGDYRDNSQDNFFGGGDFGGGFFDDALNPSAPVDYGSPSNLFGILQNLPQPNEQSATTPAPSRNLMAEIDKTRDGGDEDYGLPNMQQQQNTQAQQPQQISTTKKDNTGKLISCNNIWYARPQPPRILSEQALTHFFNRNQLQSNQDFQDGKFDLDGLCSELRAKARCSESGVMVDQDHVDKALKKLGKTKEENAGPPEPEGKGHLMFEQESWDNVLKKLGGGAARS